jgi:hypothetical protein
MYAVFVMSSESSGSNLLRRMLGQHSALAAPPPPHLWHSLSWLLPYYGPLTSEQGFRELAADAVALTCIPRSHLEWKHRISLEDVLGRAGARTLTGVAAALYDLYAEREGRTGWVCKENNLFDYAFQIRAELPHARFVYLVRDGRDYAVSVKKVPTHDQHVFFIAREWADEQLRCLRVHQELAPVGASLLLRYEDLIGDPERELRRVTDFLGLSFEPALLAHHEAEDSLREAGKTDYWTNLAKPVLSENRGKFRRELLRREVAVFEHVAGSVLELFGYPRVDESGLTGIPLLTRLCYHVANGISVRRQERRLLAEEGRKEREETLRRIRARRARPLAPFAPPLDYGSAARRP